MRCGSALALSCSNCGTKLSAEVAPVMLQVSEDANDLELACEALATERSTRLGGWAPARPVRRRFALRLGLGDDAEQHFRTGFEWCESERWPVDSGRCHHDHTEAAERRGIVEVARQHLDTAGFVFSRHGAKLNLDQVLAKKQIVRS